MLPINGLNGGLKLLLAGFRSRSGSKGMSGGLTVFDGSPKNEVADRVGALGGRRVAMQRRNRKVTGKHVIAGRQS